jgi:hypothetical protein
VQLVHDVFLRAVTVVSVALLLQLFQLFQTKGLTEALSLVRIVSVDQCSAV